MFAPSMPYQVTRTDTGQFVLIDPTSETVVIDDDLVAGFAKLDTILASKPRTSPPPLTATTRAFEFRGGPRYTPILLAIVLPFVWLLALYLALGQLLSQHSLTLEQAADTRTEIDALELELQALRSEVAGAPRAAKTKPIKRADKPKPAAVVPDAAASAKPGETVAPAKPDPSKPAPGGPN
jgi:hypothetical protein